MTSIKDIVNQQLALTGNDDAIARAEIARDLIKEIYNFVKFNRPEGGGLDGRDGVERNGLATIVDAAEEHYFKMLEQKHKSK
ncbi:hypothetical protein [Citrobacter koseri]|uniref:hypothetical protein n=1 Tax=Citrobacter koseri TaxID=545 RepID=UPI000F4DE286|nr:hypothetical protein [Citrobacter koseri]ELZ4423362.1 hypothetical protein [Salmonella enterica]AYY75497.1 hypothetical protein EGX86_17355 [Citrobacter koseri]AYY75508.1 hypothetical protein EGX86_17420 [Citrobacter koseri]QEU23680.1 hypothetical protein FOB54_08600 [Citrobacter koseri]QEU23691.1 hypothetical protein FOB54_08665 [Citrobacter koseri]